MGGEEDQEKEKMHLKNIKKGKGKEVGDQSNHRVIGYYFNSFNA